MGFIPKTTPSFTIRAYLTRLGRKYLTQGNTEKITFAKFSVGDSDYNYGNFSNKIESGAVPNITGDNTGCILSLAPNTKIRYNIFKGDGSNGEFLGEILETERGFREIYNQSAPTGISNNNLLYTLSDRTDVSNNSNHLHKTFNLPITTEERTQFQTNFGGTALQSLDYVFISNVKTDINKVMVIEIPENQYGELINGKKIKLQIPYLGTFKYIYSNFFYDSEKGYDGMNASFSDTNSFSQILGQTFGVIDPLNSNIAYMFSDDVQLPVNGGSWSNYPLLTLPEFSSTYKGAVFKNTNGDSCETDELGNKKYDICVGVAYLDKGYVVITHPYFVNNITLTNAKYSAYSTGYVADATYVNGTNFKRMYFPANSSIEFISHTMEYSQSATIVLNKNEYNKSSNPTFNQSINTKLYITEIGIYNSDNELIAFAKINEPIEKTVNQNPVLISLEVNI